MRLVSYCCAGIKWHGDDPASKVFFNFISGRPAENKLVIWFRLGRDEVYVMNPEPPSNEEAHWRVVEELR
jgi:hypothetical protein